ncbi:NHL domain-containing protein [Streptomyces cinereospinus]|uniref:NHL domain-containing protein n=1 Tax=Streptomyces cinereospinus TaxID=285561 RepID=UPI00406BD40E
MNRPYGVAVDSTGTLYIADNDNHRIRKVTTDGKISTVAGTGAAGFGGDGGAAVSAQLNSPREVAVDGTGALYIADADNHRIRKVTSDGKISTVAGTGTEGFGGDDGLAPPPS